MQNFEHENENRKNLFLNIFEVLFHVTKKTYKCNPATFKLFTFYYIRNNLVMCLASQCLDV